MENSKIQWCNHTFNPWQGCTKVSPGCLHCYAEARDLRWHGGRHWGAGKPRARTSESNWKEPLKWARASAEELNDFYGHATLHGGNPHYPMPARPRVFCASLADWLDDEVPIEWLADLLRLIYLTPELDWLLLTKRPRIWRLRMIAAMTKMLSKVGEPGDKYTDDEYSMAKRWVLGEPPFNVWVGTSVEDQTRADERIPELLKIPARIHFLSCEPLLGYVDLRKQKVDWVIAGGESGVDARKMDVAWIYALILQCLDQGTPLFVKQLGARPFTFQVPSVRHFPNQNMDTPPRMEYIWQLEDKVKGGEIGQWPAQLRIREFPT